MADLRDALAVLRNRTDLIGTEEARNADVAALWEAIDVLADTIAHMTALPEPAPRLVPVKRPEVA